MSLKKKTKKVISKLGADGILFYFLLFLTMFGFPLVSSLIMMRST